MFGRGAVIRLFDALRHPGPLFIINGGFWHARRVEYNLVQEMLPRRVQERVALYEMQRIDRPPLTPLEISEVSNTVRVEVIRQNTIILRTEHEIREFVLYVVEIYSDN
jgi:hypothetical protein